MWTENLMDRPYHRSTQFYFKDLKIMACLSIVWPHMHSFVYESTHVTYERRSKLKRFFSPRVNRLRAVPLLSVEYKLGRTGESELAERETSLRSISSFAWPSWGTACSLPSQQKANAATALSKTRTSKMHIWSKKRGFHTIFSISLIARVGLHMCRTEWNDYYPG